MKKLVLIGVILAATRVEALGQRLNCVGWVQEQCDYATCCTSRCNACFLYDAEGNLIYESQYCGEWVCRPVQG